MLSAVQNIHNVPSLWQDCLMPSEGNTGRTQQVHGLHPMPPEIHNQIQVWQDPLADQ